MDQNHGGPPAAQPLAIPADVATAITGELSKYADRLHEHAGPQLVTLLSADMSDLSPEHAAELVHARLASGKYDHFLKPQATSGNTSGNSGSFEGVPLPAH